MPLPVVMTVAGSDSSGGAGIEADLKTFAVFATWGTVALTAVTAQDSRGVLAVAVMDPGMVVAQMESTLTEFDVAATKTGMLANREIVEAVAAVAASGRLGPLVVDPVQAASAGGSLLEDEARKVLVEQLLPACRLVTPNIPEVEGLVGGSVRSRRDMEEAARQLGALGAAAVLLKGGHLDRSDSPDLLWEGGRATWLEGPRVGSGGSHGTGCTLSAAVTALLASGHPLQVACRRAKDHVTEALRLGSPF